MVDRFEKEPVFEEAQQAKLMLIEGSEVLSKSFSEQMLHSLDTPQFLQFFRFCEDALSLSVCRLSAEDLKSHEQKVCRMQLLISIVKIIEEEWLLEQPPMIINITGNATPFEMRPKYHVSAVVCVLGARALGHGDWLQRRLLL